MVHCDLTYVLHLEALGEKKVKLQKIKKFTDQHEAADYYYNSYTTEPCICIRGDGKLVGLMLQGAYYIAFYDVTKSVIFEISKTVGSQLESNKRLHKKMTPQQVHMAFAELGAPLRYSKPKKAM